jgi:hypothetical protein
MCVLYRVWVTLVGSLLVYGLLVCTLYVYSYTVGSLCIGFYLLSAGGVLTSDS